jgi:hypothetical protein
MDTIRGLLDDVQILGFIVAPALVDEGLRSIDGVGSTDGLRGIDGFSSIDARGAGEVLRSVDTAVKALVGVNALRLNEVLGSLEGLHDSGVYRLAEVLGNIFLSFDASSGLLDGVEVLGSLVALALVDGLGGDGALALGEVLGSSGGLSSDEALGLKEGLRSIGVLDSGGVVILVGQLSIHASGYFLDHVNIVGSIMALELIELLDVGDVLPLDDVLGRIDGLGSVNLGSIETLDGGRLHGLLTQLSSLAFSAFGIDASSDRKDGLGILQSIVDPALAGGLGSSIVVVSAGAEVGWALSLSFTKISQSQILHGGQPGPGLCET